MIFRRVIGLIFFLPSVAAFMTLGLLLMMAFWIVGHHGDGPVEWMDKLHEYVGI